VVVVVAVAGVGIGVWPSIPGVGASSTPDFTVIAGGASATTPPTSSGTPALSTELEQPEDVAVDASGDAVICDTLRNEIEVLAESSTNPGYMIGSGATWAVGSLYVIAGEGTHSPVPVTTGSPGAATALDAPEGVALDSDGNVLIADTGDDEVEVLAVSTTNPGYVLGASASWVQGDLYVIAGLGKGKVIPAPTSAGAPATSDGLDFPADVSVDGAGNVLVADAGHGLVEALAVGSDRPGYVPSSASWTQGDLIAIAGGGSDSPTTEGTKGGATLLDLPSGVAADRSGNVLISDTDNLTVEVLAGAATNSTYSLGSGAVWTPGYLYVVAGGGVNAPSATGTLADGTLLDDPVGVSPDASGNILIADSLDEEVEVLACSSANPGYVLGTDATWTPGNLYVLAGGGAQTPSPSGTDGLGTQLSVTSGVAVSPSGGVLVADAGDSEIEYLEGVPVPPVLKSATAGNGTVALDWSAPATDGGSPVTGYDVLVFSGGSSSPTWTLAFGANTTSCVVENVTNGVPYLFAVVATSAIGTSQSSSSLGATPQAPSTSAIGTSQPSSSGGATPQAPSTGHGSHGGHKVRPRVVLTRVAAQVRSGFATLFLRCSTRLCGGELQLVVHKDVRIKSNGRTHTAVETVLVSSDDFSIRGGAVVRLPVPVSLHAISEITKLGNFRVATTATFAVTRGVKTTYKLALVGARGR
jgi:hypothetical protein